jgi:hypothetical protein
LRLPLKLADPLDVFVYLSLMAIGTLLCLGHLKRLDDAFEWVMELCAGVVLEVVVFGIFVLEDVEVSDATGCSGNLGWGLLV